MEQALCSAEAGCNSFRQRVNPRTRTAMAPGFTLQRQLLGLYITHHLMVAESQAFASRECRPGRRRSRCALSARVHSFAVIRKVFTGCAVTVSHMSVS